MPLLSPFLFIFVVRPFRSHRYHPCLFIATVPRVSPSFSNHFDRSIFPAFTFPFASSLGDDDVSVFTSLSLVTPSLHYRISLFLSLPWRSRFHRVFSASPSPLPSSLSGFATISFPPTVHPPSCRSSTTRVSRAPRAPLSVSRAKRLRGDVTLRSVDCGWSRFHLVAPESAVASLALVRILRLPVSFLRSLPLLSEVVPFSLVPAERMTHTHTHIQRKRSVAY